MNTRVFSGGTRVDAVAADDRGLAYGDGLFETMRAHRGEVPWWRAHWARLQRGAARLGIVLPDRAMVERECADLMAGADGVVKLIVTRGAGGRGYAPPDALVSTWVLSRHPLPPDCPREGIAARWCHIRLSIQPALAGIKHCNRLEQVLARAEWNASDARDRDAHEGLMLDMDGNVVSATAANVFALVDGRWITPAVDRCGVAGVCRAWAMAALDADEARLSVTQIDSADAVFLCNAVRGILPVTRLAARTWSLHPLVAGLRERLGAEQAAFALA